MSTCHCQTLPSGGKPLVSSKQVSPVRTVSAFVLSVLVAFFPKCPMCWAAYSSALGIVGIAHIPYMGFLFPALVAMLALHLVLLFRQASEAGYGPFVLSIGGAASVLILRRYAPAVPWVLNIGILLMLGGSVWNTFSVKHYKGNSPPIQPSN